MPTVEVARSIILASVSSLGVERVEAVDLLRSDVGMLEE
jgi:hypothetical protein